MRWRRVGFRYYWRWKSRSLRGRPQIETDLRALIRRMSVENPLWGAPRIHGEQLKLGFEVAQSSVAKYMVRRRGPPSQARRTFLHNNAADIAAMDFFVARPLPSTCSMPSERKPETRRRRRMSCPHSISAEITDIRKADRRLFSRITGPVLTLKARRSSGRKGSRRKEFLYKIGFSGASRHREDRRFYGRPRLY